MKTGYKQTEIGVIPEDWEVKLLGDLTTAIGDGIHSTPKYVNQSEFYFVNGNNLVDDEIKITTTTQCVSETEYKNLKKPLSDRTILFSINGTIGNLAFYDGEQVVLGKSAAYLNIAKDKSKEFIAYSLKSRAISLFFENELTGSTIKNLSLQTLRNCPIPLPQTQREQTAIAAALSDVDALMGELDKLIAKKRDIKQATMQQLLTGKKRLAGFSGEWEVKRLGELLNFQVGFPFSSDFFNQKNEGIRLVKNRDLKSDDQIFYFSGKFDNSFLVQNGDVLIGMDGDFLPCLWSKGTAILNQRVGRIISLGNLNTSFMYYRLLDCLKDIENATSATTVKHLSHNDIENIQCEIPMLEEQTAIATILSDMDAEISQLEARRAKTAQLKQGMMQELLTGRIRLC
jgi:type I restriction enzyme S subunit